MPTPPSALMLSGSRPVALCSPAWWATFSPSRLSSAAMRAAISSSVGMVLQALRRRDVRPHRRAHVVLVDLVGLDDHLAHERRYGVARAVGEGEVAVERAALAIQILDHDGEGGMGPGLVPLILVVPVVVEEELVVRLNPFALDDNGVHLR